MIFDVQGSRMEWQIVLSPDIEYQSIMLVGNVHVHAIWREGKSRRFVI